MYFKSSIFGHIFSNKHFYEKKQINKQTSYFFFYVFSIFNKNECVYRCL